MTPEQIAEFKTDINRGCTYSYKWPSHRKCMQLLLDESSSLCAQANISLQMREALESIRMLLARSAEDHSVSRDWAWIYGIICGWDDALVEVAQQHGWDHETQARIMRLNAGINITPTEAEARVEEWKKKAERYDAAQLATQIPLTSGSMMYVVPREADAITFSNKHIAPMIRDIPAQAERVNQAKHLQDLLDSIQEIDMVELMRHGRTDKIDATLAIITTKAEVQVAEWREKAELLDYYIHNPNLFAVTCATTPWGDNLIDRLKLSRAAKEAVDAK
jgi:hypothetical protein